MSNSPLIHDPLSARASQPEERTAA